MRWALPALSPERLLSADRTRCVQTLAPLAADLRVDIELEPSVGEEEYAAAPGLGQRRIVGLARSGEMVAVRSQGAVIEHLVATICGPGGGGAGTVSAKKGSVWALFFAAGKFVASDYYEAVVGWPTPAGSSPGDVARAPAGLRPNTRR